MTDTITVRVVRSMFGHGREIYRRGETLKVDPSVLKKHPNTLERVDNDATQEDIASDEDDQDVTVDDLDPHPADLKVGELEERIAGVEGIELLETILEAEKESEDRTTAKNAIDARLNELEE